MEAAISSWPENQARVVRFPRATSPEALVDLANSLGAFTVNVLLQPGARLTSPQAEFALQIQRAALEQFRSWLPGAGALDTAAAGGKAAAVSMARQRAQRIGGLPEFAASAAELALAGATAGRLLNFPLETIVRQSWLLLSVAAGRDRPVGIVSLAALDQIPLSPMAAEGAIDWLADQVDFPIWLCGIGAEALERFPLGQPQEIESEPTLSGLSSGQTQSAGVPASASMIEQRLENFLSQHEWAAGRSWNQSWTPDGLTNPVRVDLIWHAERLAVEFDGDEHRQPAHFQADRARDRRLQAAGHRVVRFTNQEVERDVVLVASEIRRFLIQLRQDQQVQE
jgi:very-short-patch-repair endonuclease